MSGAGAVVGAAAFAVAAALVTEAPTSAGGGVVVPSDRWQSEGLRLAIAKLKLGFIGADLDAAGTLGQCFAAVGVSRPQKNKFNPNFPSLDVSDCIGATEQFFEALEKALEWTDIRLGAGATETRGLVRIVDVTGTIGMPSWSTQRTAAARLRSGAGLIHGWSITKLGTEYQRAVQNLASMKFFEKADSPPSDAIIAEWWRQLWTVAEWADTVGAPIGGEEWDEGGVLGSVLVGVQTAGGWLASGFYSVGGVVAGIVGEAAWAVLATPPGLIAICGGVWILRSRAIV